MSESKITIFYSWQSDLPSKETRNIIDESIKDAVRLLRGTVNIKADRDTRGKFGTPDITQTIFSKIDDCDIFIADVSAVCHYATTDKDGNEKIKYAPNANVMLELGYASHVIGWDNVICILNSDYGKPADMPFDIASRRLTPFSLKDGKSKGEIKRYIKDIIQDTVENILNNGKRSKEGFSNLRLGSYNDGVVSNHFNPIKLSEKDAFTNHRKQIISESLKLIEQIKNIKITEPSELLSIKKENNSPQKNVDEEIMDVKQDNLLITSETSSLKNNFIRRYKISIKEDDKNMITELSKKYLEINISKDEEFFCIGNLEEKIDALLFKSYEGTEDEENKYNKIMELYNYLQCLYIFDEYVKTFDNMIFMPLVIENISKIRDENIDIYIRVKEEDANIVIPSRKLINPKIKGMLETIIEEEIIKELLLMPETSDISYDKDITYSMEDTQVEMKKQWSFPGINGNPNYDEEDYEREIKKYIAIPNMNDKNEFKFRINNIYAKEKKWLGPALLMKPLKKSFDIGYLIKSKYSDGELSGIIKYKY